MDSENFVPGAPESSSVPAHPQEPANGSASEQPRQQNAGPDQAQARGRRRRRRGRRNGRPQPNGGNGQNRPHQQQGRPHRENRHHRGGNQQQGHNSVFTAPMDHSYRQQTGNEINGNTVGGFGGRNSRRFGRGGFRPGNNRPGLPPAAWGSGAIEPVANGDASTRIFAFIEELFFVTK